jgi:hypothetical protein
MTPIVLSGPSCAWVKSANTAATVGSVVNIPLSVDPKDGPTVLMKTTILAPANILTTRSFATVARRPGIGSAFGSKRREIIRIAIVATSAAPGPIEEIGSITAQVATKATYETVPAIGQERCRHTRA